MLITADEGRRGGRSVATKVIADQALKECGDGNRIDCIPLFVSHCFFILQRTLSSMF